MIPLFICMINFNFFGEDGLINSINGIFVANLWVRPVEQLLLERFDMKKNFEILLVKKFVDRLIHVPCFTQGKAMKTFQSCTGSSPTPTPTPSRQ